MLMLRISYKIYPNRDTLNWIRCNASCANRFLLLVVHACVCLSLSCLRAVRIWFGFCGHDKCTQNFSTLSVCAVRIYRWMLCKKKKLVYGNEWKTKDAPATKLHNYFKMASHCMLPMCAFLSPSFTHSISFIRSILFISHLPHIISSFWFVFFLLFVYLLQFLALLFLFSESVLWFIHTSFGQFICCLLILLSACRNLKHVLFY